MPTVSMHHERTVLGCVDKTLLHASRDTVSSHANVLAVGIGPSNVSRAHRPDF
jgi:hypothetical protein